MKKVIRAIAAVLCVCLVTVALLSAVSNLVSRKDSKNKNAAFFEDKSAYDVLFFGSSHMLNAAFPMELWSEYGYTSYSFAGHGSRIPTSYWVMRNALQYAKPKVAVIDCYYLSSDEKTDSVSEFLHLSLDAFAISATKTEAVFDLFDTVKERAAFLFPFSTYHNRWKELSAADFNVSASVEKGGSIRVGAAHLEQQEYIAPEDMCADSTQGVIYLRKMIDYCKSENIEVVLTYVPYAAETWGQRESNKAVALAKEYGISCLDLKTLSEQINYQTDFSDNGHLNYSGGAKITQYIGNHIKENFDIADRRADSDYQNWLEDQTEYSAYKEELMKQQTSAVMMLPFLTDKTLATVMLVNGQWEYGAADITLQDWGVSADVLESNQTFLVFSDKANDICQTVYAGQCMETSYGTLELKDENGASAVYINGEPVYTMAPNEDVGMWSRILNAETGETVYETMFNKRGFH